MLFNITCLYQLEFTHMSKTNKYNRDTSIIVLCAQLFMHVHKLQSIGVSISATHNALNNVINTLRTMVLCAQLYMHVHRLQTIGVCIRSPHNRTVIVLPY